MKPRSSVAQAQLEPRHAEQSLCELEFSWTCATFLAGAKLELVQAEGGQSVAAPQRWFRLANEWTQSAAASPGRIMSRPVRTYFDILGRAGE